MNGTIKYETTIGEVFPELARQYPNSLMLRSTLRQLLTHTSALTKQVVFDTSNKNNGIAWRAGHVPTAVSSLLLREPGTVYEYNNAGAVIATAMVERLARSSFEDWLYGTLGKRIGLTKPEMLDYSIVPTSDQVFPHHINNTAVEVNLMKRRDSFKFAPQGSCSLTLLDLCAFAKFTMTNSAQFPSEIYNGMIRVPTGSPNIIRKTNASWGWGPKSGALDHNGDTGRGEYCYVRLSPSNKSALVFYVNANYTNADDIQRLKELPGEIAQLIK